MCRGIPKAASRQTQHENKTEIPGAVSKPGQVQRCWLLVDSAAMSDLFMCRTSDANRGLVIGIPESS